MAKAKVVRWSNEGLPREGAGGLASRSRSAAAAWRGTFDSGCLVDARMVSLIR